MQNCKKVYHSGRFLEHQEDQSIRKVKEQSFSLISVQLELVVDGALLDIVNTVVHGAEKSVSVS